MKSLHKVQKMLLNILSQYSDKDYIPTMEELRTRVDASSKSVVFHHLKQLEKKGYIMKGFTNRKNYILKESFKGEVLQVKRYAVSKTPFFIKLTNESERHMFHLKAFPEDATLDFNLARHPSKTFIIDMPDDSMSPVIRKDDWLIVDNAEKPKDGSIIILETLKDKNLLIRRFAATDKEIVLSTDSGSDKLIIFSKKDFAGKLFVGVVTCIIKRSNF
jgi:SOS-response transcriptional repressors (RecA-mediated autopeptidases)